MSQTMQARQEVSYMISITDHKYSHVTAHRDNTFHPRPRLQDWMSGTVKGEVIHPLNWPDDASSLSVEDRTAAAVDVGRGLCLVPMFALPPPESTTSSATSPQ